MIKQSHDAELPILTTFFAEASQLPIAVTTHHRATQHITSSTLLHIEPVSSMTTQPQGQERSLES